MRVLNLYAGLGGNRKFWENCEVTAIEYSEKIASVYQSFYPKDTVILADAHEYLRLNYQDYDFIWSSPPCQSHSKMIRSGRNQGPRFPDLKLYEEILFLQNNFHNQWVVENVKPYYKPLILPSVICGRHLFWSSFYFDIEDVKSPPNFMNAKEGDIKKWLGLKYSGSIYYERNHDPCQVLRNCVHPLIGKQIFAKVAAQGPNNLGQNGSLGAKQLSMQY